MSRQRLALCRVGIRQRKQSPDAETRFLPLESAEIRTPKEQNASQKTSAAVAALNTLKWLTSNSAYMLQPRTPLLLSCCAQAPLQSANTSAIRLVGGHLLADSAVNNTPADPASPWSRTHPNVAFLITARPSRSPCRLAVSLSLLELLQTISERSKPDTSIYSKDARLKAPSDLLPKK